MIDQGTFQRKEPDKGTSNFLSVRIRAVLSASVLSTSLLLSPSFTPKASANPWWVRIAAAVFVNVAAQLLYDSISNPAPASPPATNAQAIKDKLSEGIVNYSNDDSEVSGRVERVWEQDRTRREESGIGAKINWDDGVTSTILFLDGSRVRVWSFGTEYGGQWGWQDGILYVKMDAGGFYRFR